MSRRSKLVAAAVLALIVIAALAIGVAARSGGGSGDAATKLAAAGCSFKTYRDQGRKHVNSLTAKVDYNSFPPTSGPHYFEPAVWGFYEDPIVQVQGVHNLEHGGIVVQWGSGVSSSTVEQLRAFWRDSPNAMLMAPLPKLGNKIALTAWTHLATCTRFDEEAFAAFRDTYRGKGPERFPVDQLTPGS